jgi:hypothetical protein
MPASTAENEARLAEGQVPLALPGRTVLIVVAGVTAAWVAAGSLGWIAPPLRRVLTCAALALALGAAWPACDGLKARWTLLAAAVAALLMTAVPISVVNVLAVVVLLAVIAGTQPGARRHAILTAALAATALAVFHMACQSTATVWALADATAGALGSVAGWAAGRPLVLGPSFAGLDFLVLMAALWLGWLAKPQAAASPGPRGVPYLAAIGAAAAIVLVHAAYLLAVACSCDLAAALPVAVPPPPTEISHLGFWSWSDAARAWLPWGLPVLAAAGQVAVVVAMFRLARWQPESGRANQPNTLAIRLLPAVLAAVAAVALVLDCSRSDRTNLRVLAYQTGGIQWNFTSGSALHRAQPAASAAAGPVAPSFGLLGPLVESLGGQLDRSTTLSEEELAEHNVVLLLPPGPGALASWMAPEGGRRTGEQPAVNSRRNAESSGYEPPAASHQPLFSSDLQARTLEFVRRGGALLVAAAPEDHPGALENVFNELLAATGIRIADQTARSPVPRWEDNVEAAAPAARGGRSGPGASFGLDGGAALGLHWPAGPLVIGRWGWGEPGDGTLRPTAYQPGQRLGDLVLAAQRQLGQGRVVVLGDAACLSDRRLPSSYPFVARLLASLAARSPGPWAAWRQWLGLAALVGFLGLVAWRADGNDARPAPVRHGSPAPVRHGSPDPVRRGSPGPAVQPGHRVRHGDAASPARRLAVAAGVLAAAVVGCTLAGDEMAGWLLPKGRPQSSRPLVYVDASHVPAVTTDPEQEDGLGQWTDTLARQGYLPLWAPDLSPARIQRAAVLVLAAPAKSLGSTERDAVREFVEGGGTLLVMVGTEEAGPSLPLLADYDLSVPEMPQPPSVATPEPMPLWRGGDTHPVQAYSNFAGEKAEAQFFAAWAADSGGLPERSGFHLDSEGPPAMVGKWVGSGAVVLVADTYFATNKNFQAEAEEGDSPRNAHFWGWLLATHTNRKAPPAPQPEPAEPSEQGPLDAGRLKPSGAPAPQSPQAEAREPAERGILEAPKGSEAKP